MRTRFCHAWILLALGCVLSSGLSGCSSDDGVEQVLIVPRVNSADTDFMLTNEVVVMVSMLEEAGIKTVVALPNGRTLQGATQSLEADLALEDVVVSDYVGVVLPCMAAAYERNDETVEIVRAAVAAGLPVAAQYGSVDMLSEAGVLDGREYAAGEQLDASGGSYSGYGVVEDDNVITSGTCPYAARMFDRPDGTPELTRLLIEALG